MSALNLLASLTYTTTPYNTTSGGGSAVPLIIAGILGIFGIVGMWRVFQKAKQPGWAAIIPIYDLYILLKIVGRPTWWIVLYLIPFVNIVISIIVALDLAKSFGKSGTFGFFGLWLFSFIGYMMLGFGDETYKGAPQR